MDHVEQWIARQAATMESTAAKWTVLTVASRWREEGPAVLARQFLEQPEAETPEWQTVLNDLFSDDETRVAARLQALLPGWVPPADRLP